jgi:hypothetical protein
MNMVDVFCICVLNRTMKHGETVLRRGRRMKENDEGGESK